MKKRGGESISVYRKIIAFVVVAVLLATLQVFPARAAALTKLSDTLSTMAPSTLADHTILFIATSGVTAGNTITLTFQSGFSLGTFNVNNEDLLEGSSSCTSLSNKTLASSPSGSTWGVGQAGQIMTFTSGTGTVTAGDCIQILIGSNATSGGSGASIITNPTAGSYTVTVGANSGGDTGTITTEIVSNSVSVTATVAQAISCALAGSSVAFGTLDTTGTPSVGGTTPVWTISTNATNGFSLAVNDTGHSGTGGLYNSAASYLLASASADLSTNSGYGLQGTKVNGSGSSAATTISSPFTATGTNVGALVTTEIPGTGTTLATASGPVQTTTVTSTLKAEASYLVPAGSYTDTLNYVCTGMY